MKQGNSLTMCITMLAGACTSVTLASEPTVLPINYGRVQDIGHIYYNVSTGERIVTVLDDGQTAPAESDQSVSIWSTYGPAPDCVTDAGYTTSFFFGVDDPTGGTPLSTQIELVQWGDIEANTVVDCITVNWVVAHPDTDTDLDSIGDGVEELAAQWKLWDADNGSASDRSTRLPLLDVLFFNLPGNIAEPGFLSGYTLDIDLVAGFTGTDLTFEIGDTDGDCQTAAFCNSSVFDSATGTYLPIGLCDNNFDGAPDSDLDSDGLFDWSWSVRFYQPGTGNDFDSDGDSGVAAPSDSDTIGIQFGYPVGVYVEPNGTLGVDPSFPDAGTGVEDLFAIYDSDGVHQGAYFFGGFTCPDDDNEYVPAAIFGFQLWGPSGDTPVCPADMNADGVLNFFDVSQFIQDYNAGGDYNGDGATNFFDVSQFIQDYNAGCP